MTRVLMVVDVQNDFCEGGSLAVSGGAEVAFKIGGLLHVWQEAAADDRAYDFVVATQDHHVDPGSHFSANPDFVHSWPPHCVAGTDGAAFHPNLDPQPFDAVFRKGEHRAAYSGFEGRTADGFTLIDWLRGHDATAVDVCGLATDYCVRDTALDARRANFTTRVLGDYIAGVSPATTDAALRELSGAGVAIV